MTVYEHYELRRRDIEDKIVRNGLTSGLVVQRREIDKALEHLTIEEGAKEYVPEVAHKASSFQKQIEINGFGYDYQ